jgi:hypothetical protein
MDSTTASSQVGRVRAAKKPGYILHRHAGYADDGTPLKSIRERRFRRAGPPSEAQTEWRKQFGAFMKGMRGRSREEIAAARLARFGPPKSPYQPRRETKGREHLRYVRLQNMAAKRGMPFVWHSSKDMRVPRMTGRNGVQYPGRAWRQELAGRPYGSRWVQDGALHGSGRVYG